MSARLTARGTKRRRKLRQGEGRPARAEGASVVVSIRLSPEERDDLIRSAKAAKVSRSEYVRSALAAYSTQ